jgi:tRNA(Ile)-lysidine synthase
MPDPSAAHVQPVLYAVREAFAAVDAMGNSGSVPRVAVALSGGRDSMVLLDAFSRLAPDLPCALSAAHVHHGLSRDADAWATFCECQCAARNVPFAVHRVRVARAGGASLEATARTARYAALATVDADVIALAHHADDQAETVLLRLLRGSGAVQLRGISPSTRVIIFTGKDDPLVRSTAMNAGALAFLTKPFDDEELLTAIRLALTSAT